MNYSHVALFLFFENSLEIINFSAAGSKLIVCFSQHRRHFQKWTINSKSWQHQDRVQSTSWTQKTWTTVWIHLCTEMLEKNKTKLILYKNRVLFVCFYDVLLYLYQTDSSSQQGLKEPEGQRNPAEWRRQRQNDRWRKDWTLARHRSAGSLWNKTRTTAASVLLPSVELRTLQVEANKTEPAELKD